MVKRIVFWVLVLAVAGGAHAQMWMGEYSSAWSDDRNWLGGEPTFGGKSVLVGKVTDPNRHEPVITEFGELTSGRFFLNGRLFIESGDLTCFSRFYIGYARSGPGEVTMTGGRIDILPGTVDLGRLSVGDESPGTVNMYDGEINVTWPDGAEVGGIHWPDGSAPGYINMYGGVIRTSEVRWKERDNCIMTFYSSPKYPHGGRFMVKADQTKPDEDPGNVVRSSMTDKYARGDILTAIPGDVILIKYDPVEDVTVVESIPRDLLPKPCELYSDAIVDGLDLGVFVDNWLWSGPPGGNNAADFDGDGAVNFVDFAILAAQWLETCE